MLPKYKSRTNTGIGLGILLQLLPRLIDMPPGIRMAVSLIGTVAFIWGCCSYAQAKGFSWAWGLLGLLSLVGLLVLFFFPDRHKATV